MEPRPLGEPGPLGGSPDPTLPIFAILALSPIDLAHIQRDFGPVVAGDRFVCIATEELHHVVARFRLATVGRGSDTREVRNIP